MSGIRVLNVWAREIAVSVGKRTREKGEGEIVDTTSGPACLGSMGPVEEFDNLEALRAESIDRRSVGCATT